MIMNTTMIMMMISYQIPVRRSLGCGVGSGRCCSIIWSTSYYCMLYAIAIYSYSSVLALAFALIDCFLWPLAAVNRSDVRQTPNLL